MEIRFRSGDFATLAVLVALLAGCADAVEEAEPGDAKAAYSFEAAELTGLCATGAVTATLSIDGGAPQTIAVDCQTSVISGQIADLNGGTHRFHVDLYQDGVWVVRRSADAELRADRTVTLNFGPPSYVDSDGDGYSNLAELAAFGQYSNAWLNADLRPLAETPRYSAGYVMSDAVGEIFLEGTSGSASYRITSNP